MKILGVIPARYASTRLEGKPLKLIGKYPMIEWVYKRALKSNLDMVIVATDSEDIYNHILRIGGNAVMTSEEHTNGTERIGEVAKKYQEYDYIINIQGDEPLIDKEVINLLIEGFKNDSDIYMSTLKSRLENNSIKDPNNVKVICDKSDYAMYFSRSKIPYNLKNTTNCSYYKHIGIYGYSRDFLFKYLNLPQGILENMESLEQLRVLENGYKIKVFETNYKNISVDTKEDLEKINSYIKNMDVSLY